MLEFIAWTLVPSARKLYFQCLTWKTWKTYSQFNCSSTFLQWAIPEWLSPIQFGSYYDSVIIPRLPLFLRRETGIAEVVFEDWDAFILYVQDLQTQYIELSWFERKSESVTHLKKKECVWRLWEKERKSVSDAWNKKSIKFQQQQQRHSVSVSHSPSSYWFAFISKTLKTSFKHHHEFQLCRPSQSSPNDWTFILKSVNHLQQWSPLSLQLNLTSTIFIGWQI